MPAPRNPRPISETPEVPVIEVMQLGFASLDMRGVLDWIFEHLRSGEGGIVLTANLDILRRFTRDAGARAIYRRASLTIADGAPIVWASRIAGSPLPERVAGASLVPRLAARAAAEGRSVFLLGGDGEDATDAARELVRASPSLRIVGIASPRVDYPPLREQTEAIASLLADRAPDIVLVAMGSPKQEALAVSLAETFPSTWFLGVGASLAFAANRIPRAPMLVQRLGLEWAHRLASEPRRLARRYLVEGLPFAAELFADSLRVRLRRDRS